MNRRRWMQSLARPAVVTALLLAGCSRDDADEPAESAAATQPPAPPRDPEPDRPRLLPQRPLAPPITFQAPAAWRALTPPEGGPVVADFVAGEDGPGDPVRIQIQRRAAASGATPADRVRSVERAERAAFSKITRQAREEYDVAGTRVVVLELEGAQKRLAPTAVGSTTIAHSEAPGQASLVAIVETDAAPYRVYARGAIDAVAQLRQPFLDFVSTLRLTEPEP